MGARFRFLFSRFLIFLKNVYDNNENSYVRDFVKLGVESFY